MAHHLLQDGRQLRTRTAILGELTLHGKVGVPCHFGERVSAQEASALLHDAWDQGVSAVIMTASYIGKKGFRPPKHLKIWAIENTASLRAVLDPTNLLATPQGTNTISLAVL